MSNEINNEEIQLDERYLRIRKWILDDIEANKYDNTLSKNDINNYEDIEDSNK